MRGAATGKYTEASLHEAYLRDSATSQWTPEGMAGLFRDLYKKQYGVDDRESLNASVSYLRHLETQVEDLAVWCVRALFSADMAWMKAKRLDFLSPANVTRYVLGVAHAMKARPSVEWKRGERPRKSGLISKPKGV